MNRVVIQEGYTLPFNAYGKRRRARRSYRGMPAGVKRQQGKMKACAKKWSGKGSYMAFMKKCLKGR
jgi:hypothetical protein